MSDIPLRKFNFDSVLNDLDKSGAESFRQIDLFFFYSYLANGITDGFNTSARIIFARYILEVFGQNWFNILVDFSRIYSLSQEAKLLLLDILRKIEEERQKFIISL